jgi:hypothetical protein
MRAPVRFEWFTLIGLGPLEIITMHELLGSGHFSDPDTSLHRHRGDCGIDVRIFRIGERAFFVPLILPNSSRHGGLLSDRGFSPKRGDVRLQRHVRSGVNRAGSAMSYHFRFTAVTSRCRFPRCSGEVWQ